MKHIENNPLSWITSLAGGSSCRGTVGWLDEAQAYSTLFASNESKMVRNQRPRRSYAVPIVAKHWDRPPNIFGETSEYVPCGAIYWHRLANMCG